MNPVHRERLVTSTEPSEYEDSHPESMRRPQAAQGGPAGELWPEHAPLLTPEEARDLSERWAVVQAGFIEEPELSVEQADALVSTAIEQAHQAFLEEREAIRREAEAREGAAAERTTEDLRLALRRYRALLGRLLAF